MENQTTVTEEKKHSSFRYALGAVLAFFGVRWIRNLIRERRSQGDHA